MQEVRIVSIEDDPLIQESLTFFIRNYTMYGITGTFDRVEVFLKHRFAKDPNLILLDIGLPGIAGHDAIKIIKEKYPSATVVMFTSYEDEDQIFKALTMGAASYISKRTPFMKVIDALHVIVNGGSYMSPEIAKKVIQHFTSSKTDVKANLTVRQLEIVKFVVDGLSYEELAAKCFISVNTVRSHIREIYQKLEINSKADLIRKYLKGEI